MLRSSDPLLARVFSWIALVASFGLSASTWDALAKVAGYHGTIASTGFYWSWLLPAAADGYIIVALVIWTSAQVSPAGRRFAKRNTYAGAAISIAAQAAYHGLVAAEVDGRWWSVPMSMAVGALAPGVAALGVHMRALVRTDHAPAVELHPQLQPVTAEEPQVMTTISEPPLPAELPAAGAVKAPRATVAEKRARAIRLAEAGVSRKEIADTLKVSVRTVQNYLSPATA